VDIIIVVGHVGACCQAGVRYTGGGHIDAFLHGGQQLENHYLEVLRVLNTPFNKTASF
jgi:hypothetical protein